MPELMPALTPQLRKPKIWKWPVGHPVWPSGGWAFSVPTVPGMWWPAASFEQALAHVASYQTAVREIVA